MHLKLLFTFLFIILHLPTPAWAWEGQVIRVTDGDTIVVINEDREQVRIRLYGIDAPESDQAFGDEATEFVKE